MSADATFMVRSEAERRAVRDYATPHFAVVSFPEDGDSAQELLDASEELIRVYREDRSRFFPGRHEAPPAAPHHAPYLPDAAEHAAALAADSLRRAKENDEGPDDRPGGTNRLLKRSKDDVSRSR